MLETYQELADFGSRELISLTGQVRRTPHGIAGRERYDLGEISDDTARG